MYDANWITIKPTEPAGMSQIWKAQTETYRRHELTKTEGLELLLQAEQQHRTNNRFERMWKNSIFLYQASIEELNLYTSRGMDKGLTTAMAMGEYLSKRRICPYLGGNRLREKLSGLASGAPGLRARLRCGLVHRAEIPAENQNLAH